jgi:hypothetical protein
MHVQVLFIDFSVYEMQIPFLPSNLAGHVKVDMLGERAHDIKQLLTAAAHSSCISYSVCLHKIASMPCSMLPPLPEPTQAAASGKVPQAANSIYPLDATASSQQQKQANMPAVVQSTVPVPPLEASPGQFEQQHAADSADTHVDEAFNGTEAASQAEPAPAADPAQQGVASLATCAPSSTPFQPSLTPQGAPAAQHMAVTNSSELRSQTEAAALMIEEAVLDGRHTADLDPGTVPHPLVLTPHRSPSPPVLSAASAAASAKVPADPGQVSVDPSKVTHLPQTTALAFESRRIQLAQMWLAGGVVPLASTLQASSPLPLNAAGPHTQVSAVDGQMHPSAHALTPQATGVEQGPPAPAVRAQLPVAETDDAVMSDDSDIGLQKLQSGMLMSRVQVAEQAQRLMLQPVLRRLSHSSSEGNRAPSTADRLAQHKQSQAQIPVSGEQRSAPQLQSAVACLVSPPQTAGPQLVAAAPQLQAVNPQATNRQASTAALQAPISASQLMGLVSSNNVSLQKLQPFGAQSSAGLAQGGTLRQLSKPSQLRSAVSMSPQPTAAQHQREEGRALESALRPASMPAQLISAAAASPQLRVANVQSSSLQDMHTLQANVQEHGDPPLPAQGVPMQQQQQQPLAMLHGPAVQQLHKLLQQMESTAQTNAMLTAQSLGPQAQSLGPPAQPNEHLHAATVAGHALEDGLPASWVRAAPAHSQQHEPQQAVPVSPPAAGNSEGDLSPWGLLPGPLHAAIACAMAPGGASPTLGGSPRAAQGLSLVRPDGAQGRGVKRPRADSAARTASTSRPGQGAQHVDTVSAHAAHILASGPAAAQVKSASIRSSDTAGKRYLTMRLSSASEPAASVQLGSNLRLADGGTAGSAQQVDSSTPADLTHAANLAVEAVPTQQARSAPQSVSPAAGFDSPVQAASALRDDSPQAAKQTQLKVPASEKALCDSWEQHLNGKQDTCQGSPPLHDGSPGGLQPANSPAKRGRSEATLDVSMSGAEQNADIDVDVSRIATPLRRKLVGVDDMAPPSSQLRRINEQEAQDALLLLHDHEPQEALQQQQGTDSDSRAGATEQDASVISDEHDMTQDTIVRPPPFTDVDGNPDAYEVDRIIDHKSWYAGSLVRMQYLVRWKGYGPEDDTWQSKTSLRHAREAIQDYHNSTQ